MFLSQVCKPRTSVFDRNRRDVVLNISDLLQNRIDGEKFFEENFITNGMQTLLDKAFERLENRNDQASTYLLSQAMGGGKTHNMIALGLLAKHPKLREKVLGENGAGSRIGAVRVIGFNGRESDAPFGVWGDLAEQLGKKEVFADLYSPLRAPGTTAWINLLKGEPTIIFLDELPPYLDNAKSIEVGNSDLSVVTATALSNLMVAVDRPELSNVCVVISDLNASYEGGSGALNQALDNLTKETSRSALPLEPVNSQGDELYHILRTRLFEELPDETVIKAVAEEYAEAVKQAKQMDITNESPESYAAQLKDSYPFHFSIRDLYARFKENPGFQQTRGLIRLMRAIVSDMYDTRQGTSRADQVKLVHPYDFNLNNEEIQSEIKGINTSLTEAIVHDIARDGHSIAEELDTRLSSNTDAQDVAKLILIASLASVPGATHGLRENEIIGFLCAPGRDISHVKKNIVDYLPTQAWYLHKSRDGRLFFKNIQNLAAKLHSQANAYNEQTCLKELGKYLGSLFEPHARDCYQNLLVLPAIDEVSLDMDKVTLVIAEPTRATNGNKLSADWQAFLKGNDFKNRVMFLTGSQNTLERIIEQARQFRAITDIKGEMDQQRVAPNDPQYREMEDSLDKITLSLRSALQETFTTLIYPTAGDKFRDTDCRINFDGNHFDGEKLIKNTLQSKGKFETDVSNDTFRKKVEKRLFRNQKISSWSEVRRAAAVNTAWQFHDPSALNQLKQRMLDQGGWADEGGSINLEPPKPVTQVNVQQLSRNHDTGECTLKITPINGDKVLYELGGEKPSSASMDVADHHGGYGRFTTRDMKLSFLCIDSKNEHEQGEAYTWTNTIDLKYRPYQVGSDWMMEFDAIPDGEIRYTTDGSDPKVHGAAYAGAFPVPASCRYLMAFGEKDGVQSLVEKIDMDQYREKKVVIDPAKPAIWNCRDTIKSVTAKRAFDFVERLKKFGGEAQSIDLQVLANDDSAEIAYTGSAEYKVKGDELGSVIEKLQSLMQGSQIVISAEEVKFDQGQQLIDWFADLKRQPNPGEVRQ
ncbi:DUF499 domain-containing protein [Endozoicomonas euniceicola]|uniref:DUF499 domain-containing protein n=1 Tax=Endozoicomonas euniceicola TaxID=1234143 RepID=A0ABY6GR76_9GAMM|nr:DUF499 domain-containing protein [Endozoicomonas euniceicola]UYM15195.1 DUF499 domain-containing protein [Endozoicomonas euniceicola]